jgi:uridine kinase
VRAASHIPAIMGGMSDLATRIGAAAPRCGDVRVVLVDGRSGAGKTTLADDLGAELGAAVLHMDELYPGWDGLAPAAAFLPALLARVAAGEPVRYRRWDWALDRWGAEHDLGRPSVLVVEGAGAGSRAAAAYASLLVWVDAPADERYRRAMARDGDTFRPHWDRWAAQEDAHFAAEHTPSRADVRRTPC